MGIMSRSDVMKIFFCLVCAGVLGGMALASADSRGFWAVKDRSGQTLSLYKESHALLIGSSRYTAGWPSLHTIPAEVEEIRKVLEARGFQVKVVMNPDGAGLENAFKDFIRDYGYEPENRLLFFFAGHGHTRREGQVGYLVPVDAPDPRKEERQFLRKALPMTQVMAWARQIEAKHALFVFDSCFSGTIFGSRDLPSVPPDISASTVKPVRQFITAGDADEPVPSESVFVPSFIRALEGEADLDKDGYVTGTELGMYLRKQVQHYRTGQTPQYGKIRDPKLDQGDFVFHMAASAPPLPRPVPSPPRLWVEGNVAGAGVLLDDRAVGVLPLEDVAIPEGRHRLRVEMAGYTAHEREIQAVSGRMLSVYVRLVPLQPSEARLWVYPEPSDARVRILNISPVFFQGMALAPGRYHVEVTASGHETWKEWLDLASGEDRNLSVRLAALPLSGDKITNSLGMTFVRIPAGEFWMGSPSDEPGRDEDEKRHRVRISKAFYMMTTEVTQGQWERVMGSTPSSFKNCGRDCPVEKVSWNEVQEFIQKLNVLDTTIAVRLPTEAEWEYAARAGTDTPFAFGSCLSTDEANYNGNSPFSGCPRGSYRQSLIKVASFKPNAWGLYDMHGNVREWVQDVYRKEYETLPGVDPLYAGSSGSRVNRGGGWYSYARNCRSAIRLRNGADDRYGGLGFRLAAL